MTQCQVIGSSPSPSPSPAPSPAPSPIPGGEPSQECLQCWQTACSASKQADCEQCMKDSKESCIPTCKPSLFGQKMMDWFCKSDLTTSPPAGSFKVTESSYNLGGFLCGN